MYLRRYIIFSAISDHVDICFYTNTRVNYFPHNLIRKSYNHNHNIYYVGTYNSPINTYILGIGLLHDILL